LKPNILVISNYDGNIAPIRPEAEIFIGLLKMGYSVWVMTKHGDAHYPKKIEAAGGTIVDYRPKNKFDSKAIALIKQVVTENSIDVIHAFNSRGIANAAWAVWNNKNVRLVSYRGYTGNIRWYDPALYLSFLNPRIDFMVCLAESVRETYLRNGVRPEKAITILKGHHPDWYQVDGADLSEFGLSEEDLVCSFVANYRTKMKGILHLVDAVSMLPAESNIKVLMIGKGLDTQEVKERIEQTKTKERFVFTGFRTDAASLVKSCHASISVSVFGEAIQKAMIEAMYLKNPVLISDISGNRGMAIHKETGYVVAPANSKEIFEGLQFLEENRDNLSVMGQRSFEHISKFLHVDKTIAEYDAFYTRISPKA